MIVEPTTWGIVFLAALVVIGLIITIIAYLPWNPHYDPKGDDPYRYCPKEED